MNCNKKFNDYNSYFKSKRVESEICRFINDYSVINGGTINGDLTINGDTVMNGDLEISGNIEINGNLDMSCNLINDVSGINFCDGTYIGHGASFDISTNEVLHLKTSQNIVIDGDTKFNNNVSIVGNLNIQGTTTSISTQDLIVNDNIIFINQTMDSCGNPTQDVLPDPSNIISGFSVYRGPILPGDIVRDEYQFVYDESSNSFRIGISGETQPVATREDLPTENGVAVWDVSTNKFITNKGLTMDNGGVFKIDNSLNKVLSQVQTLNGTIFTGSSNNTRFGDISNNLIFSLGGKGMAIGTFNAGENLIFGVDNTEIMRIDGSSYDVIISGGDLDMCCNLINDVSGINFCDGTYIGNNISVPTRFDISFNKTTRVYGSDIDFFNVKSITTSQGLENGFSFRVKDVNDGGNPDNFYLTIDNNGEGAFYCKTFEIGDGEGSYDGPLINGNTYGINFYDISGNYIFQKLKQTTAINSKLMVYNTITENIGCLSGNLILDTNLDMCCNLINDVSGINFCDGTYIGHGSSFDICANDVLVLSGVKDICGNYNGASIVSKNRVYQELNSDNSWNSVNGYMGLAKDAYPSLNPSSFGELSVSEWSLVIGNPSFFMGDICWSPELRLFLAHRINNKLITSSDGINWNTSSITLSFGYSSSCWSPELGIFLILNGNSNNVLKSNNGIDWVLVTTNIIPPASSVCWSPELMIFVASSRFKIATSSDGSNWNIVNDSSAIGMGDICWSPELSLFVSISDQGIIISSDGIIWNIINIESGLNLESICWSPELGLFVAVYNSFDIIHKVITSPDGINWTHRVTPNGDPDPFFGTTNLWQHVCWCPELSLFVACGVSKDGRIMTSSDGVTWKLGSSIGTEQSTQDICWSPELGIFVILTGTPLIAVSSLKGRPPTSYNVFDSSFNNIDQSGNWTFKVKELYNDDGIVINGNLDMACNLINDVSGINFCGGSVINNAGMDISGLTTLDNLDVTGVTSINNLEVSGNVVIRNGDLDMCCNLINDVSGINFCDGTYIGHGSSFDISTNEVLHISTSQNIIIDGDVSFNNNIEISGNIVAKNLTEKNNDTNVHYNTSTGEITYSKNKLDLFNFSGFQRERINITDITGL